MQYFTWVKFIKTKTHFAQPDGSPGSALVQKTYVTNAVNYVGEMAAFTVFDLTGNGISDIAATFYKQNPEERIPETMEYTLVSIQDTVSLASDVISKITNGFGVESIVKYQSTSNSLIFQEPVVYPLGKLKIKAWTVKETFIPDDDGNKLDHIEYDFRNPVIMHTGKGFLGFLETIFTDKVKNTKTTVVSEIISIRTGRQGYWFSICYP